MEGLNFPVFEILEIKPIKFLKFELLKSKLHQISRTKIIIYYFSYVLGFCGVPLVCVFFECPGCELKEQKLVRSAQF